MSSQDYYLNRVGRVFSSRNAKALNSLHGLVQPRASELAALFYDALLELPDSQRFLDTSVVTRRLRAAQSDWISRLFLVREGTAVETFIEAQKRVGEVHARINIPAYLVAEGIRIYKTEILDMIDTAMEPGAQRSTVKRVMHACLDTTASLMIESYIFDLVDAERSTQSLRNQLMTEMAAVECERMRASVFQWVSRLTSDCLEGRNPASLVSYSLKQHEIWLWLLHKANLVAPSSGVTEHIQREIEAVEALLRQLEPTLRGQDHGEVTRLLDQIRVRANEIAWHLSSLAEEIINFERRLDPLTRLMNRRYLPSLLRRQVDIAIRHEITFALILFDIDHFKAINDRFGHPAGDAVLSRFARVLIDSVRAVDFVFRYGGEEFLLVLSHVSATRAGEIAEAIRRRVESMVLEPDGDRTESIRITVSAGVAAYTGHPDFEQVLRQADDALINAKREGRNRVRIASRTAEEA